MTLDFNKPPKTIGEKVTAAAEREAAAAERDRKKLLEKIKSNEGEIATAAIKELGKITSNMSRLRRRVDRGIMRNEDKTYEEVILNRKYKSIRDDGLNGESEEKILDLIEASPAAKALIKNILEKENVDGGLNYREIPEYEYETIERWPGDNEPTSRKRSVGTQIIITLGVMPE